MKRLMLVTGATGFIGLPLCRRLQEQGLPVRALTRKPAPPSGNSFPWKENVQCDLGHESLPEKLMQGIDTVFHLAGVAHSFRPAGEMEQLYWAVNLEATKALLEKAREAGVKRFIYFSSVKAMADPGENCVDESWPAYPEDVYGLSKRKAEEAVLAAGKASRMHVCNLRPALVYGPGVKGNLFRMMEAIKTGRFPPLPETGNKRSLVHVEDLVKAAFMAAENSSAHGNTYIVTDGRHYSTHELYTLMCEALGRDVFRWTVPAWVLQSAGHLGDMVGKVCRKRFPIDSEAVRRLLGSACYSCTKIRKDLGYSPSTDFPAALPEMVARHHEISRRS